MKKPRSPHVAVKVIIGGTEYLPVNKTHAGLIKKYKTLEKKISIKEAMHESEMLGWRQSHARRDNEVAALNASLLSLK